ncbi:MAG: hypothetical protein JXR75_00250 [Rhodobacteraceae bacterium]|nr:hypothetical protein [Paracoccaceae bacterium]
MILTLSPCRLDAALTAEIDGETITLNGQAVDLSGVVEGMPVRAETLGCIWITGQIERRDGTLHLTLILPHAAEAPLETLWPDQIAASEGLVPLPPHAALPREPELA